MHNIKTWAERSFADNSKQLATAYMLAEIAELRAALASSATPEPSDLAAAILALSPDHSKLEMLDKWEAGSYLAAFRDALKAAAALAKQVPAQEQAEDTELLNWFDQQRTAYGFEGIQEGNEWLMNGPFPDLRSALRDCKAYEEKQRAAQLAQSADKAEG